MIKTYKITGIVEKSMTFGSGSVGVRCSFSGGAVNESNVIPAIFTTRSKVVQTLIEASKSYKSNDIELESAIEEEGDEKTPEENLVVQPIDKNGCDYSDVTTGQMAREVLNKNHNVSLSKLTNNANIMNEANLLNVTFSNWELK